MFVQVQALQQRVPGPSLSQIQTRPFQTCSQGPWVGFSSVNPSRGIRQPSKTPSPPSQNGHFPQTPQPSLGLFGRCWVGFWWLVHHLLNWHRISGATLAFVNAGVKDLIFSLKVHGPGVTLQGLLKMTGTHWVPRAALPHQRRTGSHTLIHGFTL